MYNLRATAMIGGLTVTLFFNQNLRCYYGRALRKWLNDNISGGYTIGSRHILFDDRDDALVCYLRFKG